MKRHKLLVREKDGSLRELRPKDTLWYAYYVNTPPRNKRLANQFRMRFRLPYESFVSLSKELTEHELFDQWCCKDAVGDESSDLNLLLLGALRYIGRAWTLDDLEEANGISREVNRVFINTFVEYGSTVLYKKWVIDSTINTKISHLEKLFKEAGFNGCIGSIDATHVAMLSCPSWASIMHKGYKLNVPSRTYNMTVSHARWILGSTSGHPATWNDKTLQLFDPLLCNVNNGIIPDDFEFMLYEKDKDGNVTEVCYKGVWFMCDNGYLSWSCTVPPVKDGTAYEVIRFSEWLESMRKDVECTFGILKGRFAILRYGLRFHDISRCDQLWLTCCALHNLLLNEDGLDEDWENGVPSCWEDINNQYDMRLKRNNTPFAISKLNSCFNPTVGDSTEPLYATTQNTTVDSSFKYEKYTVNNKRIVSKMPLEIFQQCLVNHFDIRFKQNDIVWPQRINKII